MLRRSFLSLGLVAVGASLARCRSEPAAGSAATDDAPEASAPRPRPRPGTEAASLRRLAEVGPLQGPDALGLRLPRGFSARIVARSSELVAGTRHRWHAAPDGGATFRAPDGGHVYVSNCESEHDAGASALRFDRHGALVDAYPILRGTRLNCSGGPTPWATWLSCEEREGGQVWECDPLGRRPAVVRPALGAFVHEAVTVDPIRHHLYLTEDVPVEWLPVPDPTASATPTRHQVPSSTPFDGGEGVWWHEGVVYFTTKGANRVWAFDTSASRLALLYDGSRNARAPLRGVDALTVSPGGDLLVAEDGGDMQLVAIAPNGTLAPLLQIVGQPASEITGPALDPSGNRLYFSSQRGSSGAAHGEQGITYLVTGPFFV